MCVVNTNKSKYECIISDKNDNYICTVPFISVSTLCRFLDDTDMDNCKIDCFRVSDNKMLDLDLLMNIWRSDFYDCEV